ncbi:MAG: mechanosensitive ion channel [Saprospiraceae bacterium]|nr:mechanosensitive ion channel [Saprospiraceae bacterium]MBK8373254.1 mechanosensitive ion channel [Saprospiraceae bacterium]MBK8819676.1 mechanosensitive ion channel [Saprospiraceae bacterium]MBK8852521.1 mechanosensitive ion channel [Saprospiraceae bacterium]
MDTNDIRIFESIIVLVIYVIAFLITTTVINNTLKKAQLQRERRKMIVKVIHLFILIGVMVILAGIWGLEQNEIAAFASTLLTALGIAFFASWSLLSNITSSIILFFNHPMKSGDTLRVLDKDYPVEGEIIDLTYFFVHVRLKSGEVVTIPNSMILQRSISIIEKESEK